MSNLHYKSNGSLDMRFNSSKSYVSSGGSIWGPSSHGNCSLSFDRYSGNDHNYHYKKDGTLDMRYKSSKEYASSTNSKFGNNTNSNSTNTDNNNEYHYKKDGTLDMRFKTSKNYVLEGGSIYGPKSESYNSNNSGISFTSSILGDEIESIYTFNNPNNYSNSNNIQNIQNFQNSLKTQYPNAPSSLDSCQVIQESNGQRKIYLGIRTVYHATTYESAQSILRDRCLHKGLSGMFGAGIYFASTMAIAKQKSNHPVGAYVQCNVNFGYALILECPNNNLTLADIQKYGCISVMGRNTGNWEFIVYEPQQTSPIKMISLKHK